MGRVYVDREDNGKIMEFCYENKDGDTETVTVNVNNTKVAITDGSDEYLVYVDDIPNLIKALRAAYTYYEENV